MGRAQQQQSAGSHWRFSFLYCWSWALAIHTQMACQLKTCRATLLWVHNFNQDCFFFPSLEMHAFCMSQLLGCGCIFNTSKSRNEHENEDSRSISSCAIFLTRAAWWSSISLLSLSHTHTDKHTHTHIWMYDTLRVIRACCVPSASLPQDGQKSALRKRKSRNSCREKMHQSAWLKAIISHRRAWNVGEWNLWRKRDVYLFTFVT